jgi:microcystin-dependent protein
MHMRTITQQQQQRRRQSHLGCCIASTTDSCSMSQVQMHTLAAEQTSPYAYCILCAAAAAAAAAGMRKNAPAAAAAPKAKAVPKPAETSGGDLDPRSVALPGANDIFSVSFFRLSQESKFQVVCAGLDV